MPLAARSSVLSILPVYRAVPLQLCCWCHCGLKMLLPIASFLPVILEGKQQQSKGESRKWSIPRKALDEVVKPLIAFYLDLEHRF